MVNRSEAKGLNTPFNAVNAGSAGNGQSQATNHYSSSNLPYLDETNSSPVFEIRKDVFVLEAKHPAYAAEPTLSDSVPGVLGAPGDSGVPHLFVLEYCSGTGKTGRHFGKDQRGRCDRYRDARVIHPILLLRLK